MKLEIDKLEPLTLLYTERPIFLMNQEGVKEQDKKAVLDGIQEILKTAEFTLEVADFGVWRRNNYLNNNELTPSRSIDWYVKQGQEKSRNKHQLNAGALLNEFQSKLYKNLDIRSRPHFNVVLVNQDIYSTYRDAITNETREANFVIGIATPLEGTLISTYRFQDLDADLRYECIKTETIHEVGHVFSLVSSERGSSEYSLGTHCTNICTMRQGLRVPEDWIRMTKDRLTYGALCSECTYDLKQFFKKEAKQFIYTEPGV